MKIFDPKLTGSIEIQSQVSGSIVPSANETFDLGTAFFRWNDLYLAGSTIDLGGTKMSKDADGNVEFKDSSNNRKKIIVEEIVIGSGDNEKRLKVENGKSMMVDKLGAVMTQMAGLIMPHSHDIYDLGTPETQWKDIFAQGNIIVGGTVDGVDIQAMSASVESNESNISVLTGATGSYLLNTTDTLTGNLTVTGTLTAQEFHTEFVSASILYDSGSTKFGDTSDDNHDFTGSLNVLGSITGTVNGYLPLAGGTMTGDLKLNDNVDLYLGTGNDFQAYHDGSNTYLRNLNGSFIIKQDRVDEDLIFESDDGTGSTTPYFFLDGSQTNVNFQKDAIWADNKKALFGGSGDLQIYHDGSHSYISDQGTGNLNILASTSINLLNSNSSDYMARFNDNGSNQFFYDGSKKVETTSTGVAITGGATFSTSISATGNSNSFGNTSIAALSATSGTFSASITSGGNTNSFGGTTFTGDINLGNFNSLSGVASDNLILKIDKSNSSGGSTFDIQMDGTTSAFFINNSRNVGIGTTSPSQKLDVVGNAKVSGVLYSSIISNNNGVSQKFRSSAASDLMTILEGGNVGIGTTSPSQKLEVNGNIQLTNKANSILLGSAGANGVWGAPKITRINSSIIISDYSGVQIGGYDGTSYGPRMTVLGTGNVGIGTTSPVAKLHIKSPDTSSFVQAIKLSNQVGVGGGSAVFFKTSGAETDDRYGAKVGAVRSDSDNGSSVFKIQQELDNGSGTLSGLTDTFTINQYGSVGIGTTNPHYYNNYRHLTINGTSGAGFMLRNNGSNKYEQYTDSGGTIFYNFANVPLKFYTSATEKFRINGNGNIGIGTTSPERLLSLYSDNAETTPRLLIEQDGTGDAVMAFSLTSGQGWSMGIDNSGGDAFMIHNSAGGVDSSSQFVILNSGNVGIGTTSPSAKLEVNGNIKHTGLTPTEGTDIDQIKTFTVNLTVSSDWIDTGISYNDLATGTYTMQCTFNDSTNGSYSMGYVGTIMWYGGTTNDGGSDEILTHRAGHAPTSRVHQFRTIHSSSVSAQQLRLQIKQNNTPAAGTNYTFKFRRLI